MASSRRRKIDNLPLVTKRPVEMQVLCFGMSRTATMSMKTAFGILGYKSYHGDQLGRVKETGVPKSMMYWKEGIENKYLGKGKPFERAEFDKLLKNYSAVSDLPCILFADELLAAYPNAKVVLNTRDPDQWVTSISKTFYVFISWRFVKQLAALDSERLGAIWWLLTFALDLWTKNDRHNRAALRQGFLDHYEHVRSIVPKEKLLEFNPAEGWEPLCKYLGKNVPEEPFPHINDAESLLKMMKTAYWILVRRAVVNVLWNSVVPLAAVGAVAGGVWWMRGGRRLLKF